MYVSMYIYYKVYLYISLYSVVNERKSIVKLNNRYVLVQRDLFKKMDEEGWRSEGSVKS